MFFDKRVRTVYGSTMLFVLLWSSGGIFSRLGLEHASPFAFLTLRFAIALAVLSVIASARRSWLPARGTRLRVALTGLLLLGSYSISYFLALDHGMTPGALATVLGVQPILTLFATERRYSKARLLGLAIALSGLVLVVHQSLVRADFSLTGAVFGLAALASMTSGAILQKGSTQAPTAVLPLQYAVSLLLCLSLLPFQPLEVERTSELLVPLLWLAIVISVVAQLLLYRLIQAGNLVNVTSVFYLVPAGTALLDYLVLGNRMTVLSIAGMAAIVLGLVLVLRRSREME